MCRPPGTNPGSQRSTSSWSVSLCSPTSWRTTVATNVFVSLPTRKRSLARIGVRRVRFPYPLARRTVRFPFRTTTIAPGTPAATTASSAAWSLLGSTCKVFGEAVAMDPAAVSDRTAATAGMKSLVRITFSFSLVLEGLEHVQARGTSCRHDGGEHASDDRDDRDPGEGRRRQREHDALAAERACHECGEEDSER